MFTIGEFSRIARVSRRLLQFYDDEKILRPVFVDTENRYRHYGASQLADLNRILALKELGLSLAEIKYALSAPLPKSDLRLKLEEKRKELERDLESSIRRLRSLEARLAVDTEAPDVILKEFTACDYVYRNIELRGQVNSWEWVKETASIVAASLPNKHIDTFTVRLPGAGYETRDTVLEAGVSLHGTPTLREIPTGFVMMRLPHRPLVATVAQPGGPDMLHRGCAAIGKFIELNGYKMVAPPREAFLEWPSHLSCDDSIIESQFEVRLDKA